jgi:hypothetical protein
MVSLPTPVENFATITEKHLKEHRGPFGSVVIP